MTRLCHLPPRALVMASTLRLSAIAGGVAPARRPRPAVTTKERPLVADR